MVFYRFSVCNEPVTETNVVLFCIRAAGLKCLSILCVVTHQDERYNIRSEPAGVFVLFVMCGLPLFFLVLAICGVPLWTTPFRVFAQAVRDWFLPVREQSDWTVVARFGIWWFFTGTPFRLVAARQKPVMPR
jgi:hypothetical protein